MTVEDEFLGLLDGFLVGEGEPPAAGGWQGAPGTSDFRAYVMVKFGQGITDGSIASLDTQIDRSVYTTCVAATPGGCRILSDAVIVAVRHHHLSTDDRTTTCPITTERIGPVEDDDTVQPTVWMAVHEFRVDTVPT